MRDIATFVLLICLLCSAFDVAGSSGLICPSVTKACKNYKLQVTDFRLKLPDGRHLAQLAYNGSQVGPTLVFDLGDEVSIDLENTLSHGVVTSTHWHGMVQHNTPWADGVSQVSQAPIAPGTTFRYKFTASPAGTFWYHSHFGVQYGDGLRGPLIVRDPKDPYKSAYDEERVLMVADQARITAERQFAGLEKNGMYSGRDCGDGEDYADVPYYALLANGKGYVAHPKTGKALGQPEIITVKRGRRYRFRVIQGSASFAVKMVVQGHMMDIIALDGYNTERTRADGFVATPGERVDFLLHASAPVGNYWVQLATLPGQGSPAILHYEGALSPLKDPALGAPNLDLGCAWARPAPGILDLKNATLRPYRSVPPAPLAAAEQHVVYLIDKMANNMSSVLGMANLSRPFNMSASAATPNDSCPSMYCWSLNWVNFMESQAPLLLLPPKAKLGNSTYVQDLRYGAVVDIALINPSTMVHPMHSHGYGFWVLAAGNGDVLKADGSIDYNKLNLTADGRYVMRDTVAVPNAVGGAGGMAGGMRLRRRRLPQTDDGMGMGDVPAPAPSMSGMTSPPAGGTGGTASSPMGGTVLPPMGGMPMGGMAQPPMASNMPPAATSQPSYGYTIIRIKADNPGVWAFHCHIDTHAAAGMFMAFRIAGPDPRHPWTVPPNMQCKSNGKGLR